MSRYLSKENAKKRLDEYIYPETVLSRDNYPGTRPCSEILVMDSIYLAKKYLAVVSGHPMARSKAIKKHLSVLTYIAKSLGIYSEDALKAAGVRIRLSGWAGVLVKERNRNRNRHRYFVSYEKYDPPEKDEKYNWGKC